MFGHGCVIMSGSTSLVAGTAILPAISRTGVVPARRYPGTGAVATIAGIGCCHVRGMLAFRDPPIMASGALPRHGRTMVVARPQPSSCIEVTAFARSIGYEMSVGFGCRHDALADRMASVAISRCAFKHAARMAGFASCRGVSAG